ncbi:MAG TPA: alpha/beta hydrolase [Trueperaceae bacterium]
MAFLDTPYHIEREDADLYVEQVGPESGPLLYYLHGGPGYNSYSFRDLIGDDLESFRMIYADQRGAGRSYAGHDFELDDLAEDVVTVLDALELPATSLLAHGFGALIAARFATRFPERLERLLFVNPWFSMPLLARALQREAAVASRQTELALPPEEALADPEALDAEELVDQAFEWVAAKQLFDRMEFPDPSSRLRLEHSDSEALLGPHASAMPAAPWKLEVLDELSAVAAPTVVMASREDRTSYPEQAEAGLERLPHALFSLLPGGHYPWIDGTDAFLSVLREGMSLPVEEDEERRHR